MTLNGHLSLVGDSPTSSFLGIQFCLEQCILETVQSAAYDRRHFLHLSAFGRPPIHLLTIGNHANTLCHFFMMWSLPEPLHTTIFTFVSRTTTCLSPSAPRRPLASSRPRIPTASLLRIGSPCRVETHRNCALRKLHGLRIILKSRGDLLLRHIAKGPRQFFRLHSLHSTTCAETLHLNTFDRIPNLEQC